MIPLKSLHRKVPVEMKKWNAFKPFPDFIAAIISLRAACFSAQKSGLKSGKIRLFRENYKLLESMSDLCTKS